MTDFTTLVDLGVDYAQFVSQGTQEQIQHLQQEQAKTEREDFIRAPLREDLAAINDRYTLLVAAEMWCPDCLRNVPAFQALCLAADIPMKIITRDQAAPLFERFFEVEKVKIPFVAVLDAKLRPVGTFIERPQTVKNGDDATLTAYKQGERLADAVEELADVIKRHELTLR